MASLQGAGGIALGAGAALAVVLAGLVFSGRLTVRQDGPTPPAPVAQTGAVAVQADPAAAQADPAAAATPAPASDSVPVSDPVPAPAVQAQQLPADPTLPSFDLVRVQLDGETLVAGAAAPGAEVELRIDGVLADTARADASGRFVSFLSLPPSDRPRSLSLHAEGDAGSRDALEQVILAPTPERALFGDGAAPQIARSQDNLSETAPPQLSVDAPPGPASSGSAPEVTSVAAPDPAQASLTLAGETQSPALASGAGSGLSTAPAPSDPARTPAVILSNRDGVDLLQPPGDPAAPPGVQNQVALDAITYEADGAVVLSGRGTGEEAVRLYLDNRPVSGGPIGADGRWRLTLQDVDSGTYQLRIDQMDTAGGVTSRVESPFLRETADALAAAAAQAGSAPVRVLTVQPGNTLWAIARDRYGEGTAYLRVFEANRESIRNPDLIYPGQVFSIPD
ncbi:MAG: LysM peptidoglycan-binding domain-containing protein [Rhodobacterales bacterium]